MPFEIGFTYFNGATPSTTDQSANWEGREFWVQDKDYSSSSIGKVTDRAFGENGWKKIRIVRNVSGVTLLPGMLVTFKTSTYGRQVDGFVATSYSFARPVDEFLNSTTGCPNNDLCYIVMQGPASVRVSATASEAVISQGSVIYSVTAAASTNNTTAGRVLGAADIGAASTYPGNQLVNRIGVMLSASTTGQTNTNLLALINPWS